MIASVLLAAASCKPHAASVAIADTTTTPATQKVLDPKAFSYDYHRLEGIYGGDFGGTDIRIILRHITPTSATGYNLHDGLRRNISGTVAMADKGIQFTLSEPGDDAYDGTFSFTLDTSAATLSGTWKPKNSSSTSAKSYTLQRIYKDTTQQDYSNTWTEGNDVLTIDDEGLCTYKYYPPTGQMEEIRGNWVKQSKGYIIYWQKNPVFPEKLELQLKTANEYSGTLKGGGHTFTRHFMG